MCFCSESPAAQAVQFHLASHETQEVPMSLEQLIQHLDLSRNMVSPNMCHFKYWWKL